MQLLKATFRTGFAEMALLGLVLAAVAFGMGDSLTANPDRVSRLLGLIIGLLLARGLGGMWQTYRAANKATDA